jgi:hypothetical protein
LLMVLLISSVEMANLEATVLIVGQ